MSNINSDKWLEAMKSEMDSMGSNQVWTLVDPPKGVRPVGCKWVYKRKLRADGNVTTFKARLVAKGYTQLKEAQGTISENRRNGSNKKIKTQQQFKAIKSVPRGVPLEFFGDSMCNHVIEKGDTKGYDYSKTKRMQET
ncbi:UNVERIFIED_CONTAM: hypothetical protein Slati_3751700 [Sesamum latifolium]|uniref:Reverse transcriptase Ty1/copia-type domain-containing protein n=1 Tax=Sesamum latifolium TaxID=2727402 RepID=A0AAW2U3R5_9LAMI